MWISEGSGEAILGTEHDIGVRGTDLPPDAVHFGNLRFTSAPLPSACLIRDAAMSKVSELGQLARLENEYEFRIQ